MMKRSFLVFTILAMVIAAVAQQPQSTDPQKSKHDSMETMNQRGDKVMGFDHTLTTHHFLLKPNGGVIQIEANDRADTVSRDQIRKHMRHIAKMFGEGNFSAPMLIHEQNPPGAAVMKELKDRIQYEFAENAGGAFIRISTSDPAALKAIHEFLRYQIKEHMTGDPLDVSVTKQ
jgi:hypothetical protein